MSTEPKGRIPPHDRDAERAVLGACLLDAECVEVARGILDPSDFYRDAHALIFEAISELARTGQPADAVLVRSHLLAGKEGEHTKLARIGGDEYLDSLTDTIPTVKSVEGYAKRVRELATLRTVIHAAHQIAAEGYEGAEDTAAFCDRALAGISSAVKRRSRALHATRLRDILDEGYSKLAERAQHKQHLIGYSTGFWELDDALGGFVAGDVIVVAGRPGMGKTAFANSLKLGVARSSRKPVACFELEMTKEQLGHRVMSSESGVPLRRVRAAMFDEGELSMLAQACDTLGKLPIWIVAERKARISQFAHAAREVVREDGPLGMVVIDYLQIARPEQDEDTREREVAQMSADAKSFAGEFGCPVVLLSQLNRGVEQRGDKRPQLSDLRESGAIEQDADTVLFLYRDEVYNPGTKDRGLCEVIVAKQRSGAQGTVKLRWSGQLARFDNMEPYPHRQEGMTL